MIVMIGNIWTQNVVYKINTKTLNISYQEPLIPSVKSNLTGNP